MCNRLNLEFIQSLKTKNLANVFKHSLHIAFIILYNQCDIIRASVPRCRILPRKCPAGYLTIFCRRFLIGEIEFSLGFADCVSSRGSETRSALRRLDQTRRVHISLPFSLNKLCAKKYTNKKASVYQY